MKTATLFPALTMVLGVCLSQAAAKPNVVLIFSDDSGWADVGFMRAATPVANPGAKGAIPTPNLDRLASRGVAYTNGYAATVCAPSRAMITTGKYGSRFGFSSNTNDNTTPIASATTVQGLPTDQFNLWERMQSVGYDTAAVGKWHLGQHADSGATPGNRPENQGIERFEGIWAGSRTYSVGSATGAAVLRRTLSDGAGAITSDAAIESQYSGQYFTDVLGDLSVDYIRDKVTTDADPFFLYSSFTAAHGPLEAKASDLAYIDSLGVAGFTGNRRTQAAMQYALDRNVGKILDSIDDPNGDGDTSDSVAENTLILFINDNGGDCCDVDPNSSSNGLLRNGKGSIYEGGYRVPYVVAGAGVPGAKRGTVSEDLVHVVDLLPTAFVGAAGGSFQPGEVIDGKNLLSYINGESAGVPHEDLFYVHQSEHSAVRRGDWKYLYVPGTGYQLYNLRTDPSESNNVAGSPGNATLVGELHQLLASYRVQMEKPRHDNRAPTTNQFDHFRFREDAFATASYSSAGAWVDGDAPGASRTASAYEGYANNRITFRAKASGDYTVANDLTSVGGFGYMANELTFASATAPLTADRKATFNGLPLLLVNSLTGEAPRVNLDATDAVAGRFTFEVNHDVEVYDDLTIAGDGNQNFVFGGKIKEFRPGRGVTKVGSADVTFGGGLDVSGVVDLQGGKVAFTNGQVGGDLVARAGVALQVGGVGIVASTGGGGPRVEIVQAGLDLNYDAALDSPGDGAWTNAASTAGALAFAAPLAPVSVSDSVFRNLTAAYSGPVAGGASGLNNYFESSGPRSVQDATFEMVFKVENAAAGSDQVLLEVGGMDRGVAFVLNGGVLTFNVDGNATDIVLNTPVAAGWRHAVGVIDLGGSGDSVSLYLDNQLVGTLAGQTIGDWAGGNTSAVLAGSSSVTGVSSGVGAPFHGDLAVARYYANTVFGAAEVDQNHRWLLQPAESLPEAPAVTLAVDGAFELEAGSSLAIDLLNATTFDRVAATGEVQLSGNLIVSASAGAAVQAGDEFAVVTGSAVAGQFGSLDLPNPGAGLMWQMRYEPVGATLLATVAGDFNGDGAVDAADYTVWRDMLGQQVSALTEADADGDGQVTQGDLAAWRQNYGTVVASLSEAKATPEPTAAAIAVVGGLFLGRVTGTAR